ncbi:hypothetical protein J437_LFUL008615 [Ladona fulva]|uniref:Transmembrane protein 120 homolog n=1 Tax=Ladona fulva TaxID=123851 RepID=A0A8K0P5P8_LADFU|nr:hypothetical protein J437_LFUL008615 [Ladona fulva]
MEYSDVDTCEKDWADLGVEFKALEALNKEYIAKLEEVGELQAKCLKDLNHQRYRLSVIKRSLKRVRNADPERVENLEKEFMRRKAQLYEMEQSLPKQNGTYLKIILGNVNVSILNKNDKFKYKDEYEKFKLILSVIGFVLAVINLVVNVRALELAFMFLLVWYYCTLTIRESILKVNGSRIKGWWRLHHFISTVLAGVLLIWPNSEAWYEFRTQFMWFNVYISNTKLQLFLIFSLFTAVTVQFSVILKVIPCIGFCESFTYIQDCIINYTSKMFGKKPLFMSELGYNTDCNYSIKSMPL